MYVRWKRRTRKARHHYEYDNLEPGATRARKVIDPEWLRTAHLVESVRVNGSPRQRTLAYLGSIRERHLDPNADGSSSFRGFFWRDASAKLDGLTLDPEHRDRIEASLEVVVPRPSDEAIARDQQARDARIAAAARLFGGRPS